MKTVLETLESGVGYLEKRGVENGRLNMQWMLAEVLGCSRLELYLQFDRPLTEEELAPLREMVRRRGTREPLQHVLGWVEFCDHRFRIDRRALIPRPETEELSALLLDHPEWAPDGGFVADVGCGSGVIGLSLARAWAGRGVRVECIDLSAEALALAAENRSALGLEEAVTLHRGDLLESTENAFDLMVANLPYVREADMEHLSPEVRHEPVSALTGGPDGLESIRRLAATAPGRMRAGGRLALEVGYDQGEAVAALCRQHGFAEVELRADLSGIPRFVIARIQS